MAKKAAKKKTPKKAAKAAPKSRAKQERLPEMKLPKVRSIDAICEQIADTREVMNESRQEDKRLCMSALALLQKHGLQGYKAHGVELFRVSGDEKIRVRLVDSDEGGDADEAERELDVDERDGAAADVPADDAPEEGLDE